MKKFYLVDGPKIGQAEESFRRLYQIGGTLPGWRLYPHAVNSGSVSVVVYGGRLPTLHVEQASICCVRASLLFGWGILLGSQVLASRAAGRGEAEGAQ